MDIASTENMMDTHALITLYNYYYWATGRVFEATHRAGEMAFTTSHPELYYGSLQGTLTHILSAEWIWRKRCQEGTSPSVLLDPLDFPTIDDLARRMAEEQSNMLAFLDSLNDADLVSPVNYQSTNGQPYQNTLWHLLVHVVNHGTQHRSEAALVLTGLNQSPGNLDMLIYFRQSS